LQHQPQRADAEPPGGHLPVRAVALRGVAEARLDRGAAHHRDGAGAQHPGPIPYRSEEIAMTMASANHQNGAAQVSVPVATHARVDTKGLPEKIAIRNLEFFYGESRALKSISLSLYGNKVTAFIGPSGCGKSTLLRILNRMYDLYPGQRATGEVMFDGENLLRADQDINLLRARIGMVFQKPTPFPMSIYENIAFGIRLYERLPRSEVDQRLESA